MCINLIRLCKNLAKKQNIPEDSSNLLKLVDEFISNNSVSDVTVNRLAHLAGYSENYFRIQFKKITDMSPLKYVNHKKIEMAKELLLNNDATITSIAYDLGFSSSQYFSTFFKRQTSFTPEEFRKEVEKFMKKNVTKIVTAKEAAAQLDSFFRSED